jgi:hypothetical protein
MARESKPHAANEDERRKRILSTAEALGLTHKRLAAAAGLKGNAGQVRFHRWTRGRAHLDENAVAAMERLLSTPLAAAGVSGADGDGSGSEPMTDAVVASVIEELGRLAGEVPEDERDGDVMRYLARKHAAAIFGQALRLMVGAKSEGVRARMVEFLKETGFGKAIQAFEDKTPKPPMEDEEFIDSIRRMIDAEKQRRANAGLPVPAVPGDDDAQAPVDEEQDALVN